MKRIEAVVRPHKQSAVLFALAEMGITNATVIETLGLVRQTGPSLIYEPANLHPETLTGLVPKRMVLLFVSDELAPAAVAAIKSAAFTGESGDGKIVVSEVDETIRIRPKSQTLSSAAG